jgi:hypothetical protein
MGVEIQRRALAGATLLIAAGLVASAASAAPERRSLAIFHAWGAFRDGSAEAPARCYAIAEPPPGSATAGRGAFASVASWPGRRIRAQIAIRLSQPAANGGAANGGKATLSIGDAAFPLVAQGRAVWAHDRRQDAAIVAAMRSGSSMSVSAVGANGSPFADVYRLRGAASAIDTAALACPMR